MRKISMLLVLALIFSVACSTVPKPYYETKVGKKKQRYYNAVQYGKKEVPDFPKSR
ncbi:MAG: hypothetical protein KF846_10465 [Cyclobacteriaceae bacterium]|nr:hypothetical protein [Cyclobacteriaceae bacterium]